MEILISMMNLSFLILGSVKEFYRIFTITRKIVSSLLIHFFKQFSGLSSKTFASALIWAAACVANAEISIDIYGGYQTSPHSIVTGKYQTSNEVNELQSFNFTAGWKGKSFSMPPYYGLRLTNWTLTNGWGLDFTHSKVYADRLTLTQNGFERLQFTDGLNNLTLHRQILFDKIKKEFLAYYGYGFGVIVPHVEFQVDSSLPRTFAYQYGGPTLALNGGIRVPINEGIYLFSEYKFTASWLDVRLNGGGSLKTRIFTNALNVGLGFNF